MSKKLEGVEADIERIADAIWAAEYLVVCAGPAFDTTGCNPLTHELCDASLVAKPNRLMGFWGANFNEYADSSPHEGYHVIARWRDKLFSAQDIRKRKQKKGDEEEVDAILRCMVYTGHIGNSFQKVGFPAQEMMEMLGNINIWQCAQSPVCCSKNFGVDKDFRFYIDPLTKEALPIKYVPPKEVPPKKPIDTRMIDSDDEEREFRESDPTHQLIGKLTPEEKARRAVRHTSSGRTLTLVPAMQSGFADRFPDMFDLSINRPTITFPDALPPSNLPVYEVEPRGTIAAPPLRNSHLLAHTNLLDRHMYDEEVTKSKYIGSFYAADPERWKRERDQLLNAVAKGPMGEAPTVATRRNKFVRYNISMVVVGEDGLSTTRTLLSPASSATDRGEAMDRVGLRTHVIPPTQLQKLTTVYGAGDEGSKSDAVEGLMEDMDRWSQGDNGWYYFSNVQLQQVLQEPLNNTYLDGIKVPFPIPKAATVTAPQTPITADLSPAVDALGGPGSKAAPTPAVPAFPSRLPVSGTVSFVVEIVLDPFSTGEDHSPLPHDKMPGATAYPYLHTTDTWQLAGHIDTSLDAIKSSIPDMKGVAPKDPIEYILQGRKGHCIRIGSLRSNPRAITYVNFEVPVKGEKELGSWESPTHITTLKTPSPSVAMRMGHPSSPFANSVLSPRTPTTASSTELVPTLNHILCKYCREQARPFVNMSKPGSKDTGFASACMAQRSRQFKIWEKAIIDGLKSDPNKSIVLLEVGCERKPDVARAYSEKTFKLLKTAKCTFVRLSKDDLTVKKQTSPASDNPNSIAIVGDPINSLNAIETAVNERIRKKG